MYYFVYYLAYRMNFKMFLQCFFNIFTANSEDGIKKFPHYWTLSGAAQ